MAIFAFSRKSDKIEKTVQKFAKMNPSQKKIVNFIKLKYLIPKSAFISNSLFGEYGESTFDWIGYAYDFLLAFADREPGKRIENPR